MEKWNFPHGIGLTPSGHNNTAIEQFKDDTLNSLTREVIQNSLDALRENQKTVKIHFNLYEMASNLIPGKSEIINFALNRAYDFWEEKQDFETLKYLDKFKKVIEEDRIRVLKISDYNTTGLNEENYESLIIGNAYSVKGQSDSSGSKGIGKAAPFAASDLRMVFYNTVPTASKPKSAGVMNFVSFNFQGENITQERASFLDVGKKELSRQSTFEKIERKDDEYGTDLYILGFKEYDFLEEKILLYTLNNFLISLHNNDLEVKVGNKIISKENIEDVIESLKEVRFTGSDARVLKKTISFYDVLTNKETKVFKLPEEFLKYEFIQSIEDAELFLLEHEPATRTVLQVRRAGMKIYERTHINGTINFTGIFQAKGKNLNVFLKDMENANHDKWSPNRYGRTEEKVAQDLLNALYQWFKNSVRECFEKPVEDEIEAYGIAKLLPNHQTGDSETEIDSGIENTISSVKVERKSEKTVPSVNEDGDDALQKDLDSIGLAEGDTSGSGSSRTGGNGGDNPDNHHGLGEYQGDLGSGSGREVIAETVRRVSASNSLKFKIIAVDYTKGEYKLRGQVKKRMKECEIELKNIGADGQAYKIKINSTSSQNKSHIVHLNRNKIYIKNLRPKDILDIDIKISSKLRMKMEGIINEIKA